MSKLTTGNIERMLSTTLADLVIEPCLFVSETDIHFWVMHNLVNSIPILKTKLQTGASRGGIKGYRTYQIHKEYGHNSEERPGERSDIVILDRNDIAHITDLVNLATEESYLAPNWIFEFGTEKSGGISVKRMNATINNASDNGEAYRRACEDTLFWEHLLQDYNKVARARKMGYVINIFRNFSKKQDKSNKDKMTWCEIVGTEFVRSHSYRDNVKFIIMNINLGSYKQRPSWKIRLLSKDSNNILHFYTVAQKRIQQDIKNHLSGMTVKKLGKWRGMDVIKEWNEL